MSNIDKFLLFYPQNEMFKSSFLRHTALNSAFLLSFYPYQFVIFCILLTSLIE